MNDEQNTVSEPVVEAPAPASEPVITPTEQESSQPNGSIPTDLPPEAPELPTDVSTPVPVEDRNQQVNVSEIEVSEVPKEAPISESVQPVQPAPIIISSDLSATSSVPQSPVPPVLQSSETISATSQSPVQQNQTSFIRVLLAKANSKLFSNRQKKLDKIIQLAQKKGSVTNELVQDLLHCSDATATRYLTKLVQQGRLSRENGSHWVKYRFIR